MSKQIDSKEVKSINKNVRSSVRKLNPILKDIVGNKVEVARRNLEFSEKRITKDIKNLNTEDQAKAVFYFPLLLWAFGIILVVKNLCQKKQRRCFLEHLIEV